MARLNASAFLRLPSRSAPTMIPSRRMTLIVARLRLVQNFLVLLVWCACKADGDKVQPIEECRIVVVLIGAASLVVRAWIKRMSRRKFAQHVIGSNLGLLNGGKPLSQHAGATRKFVGYFDYITSSIDVGDICAHAVIDLHAAPACDTTGLNKIDERFDADGDQHQIAGNARTAGRYYF